MNRSERSNESGCWMAHITHTDLGKGNLRPLGLSIFIIHTSVIAAPISRSCAVSQSSHYHHPYEGKTNLVYVDQVHSGFQFNTALFISQLLLSSISCNIWHLILSTVEMQQLHQQSSSTSPHHHYHRHSLASVFFAWVLYWVHP